MLATDVPNAEVEEIKKQLSDSTSNPRDLKRRLAREIVALYHSAESAQAAQDEFDRIFVKKDLPDEIEEMSYGSTGSRVNILQLLAETKLAPSKSEARRLVDQGGVSVDGEKMSDSKSDVVLNGSKIIKVGKRKFLKIIPS